MKIIKRSVCVLWFLFFVVSSSIIYVSGVNKLEEVSLREDGGNVLVNIFTSLPAKYKIIELTSPDRIVVDLENIEFLATKKTIPGKGWIKSIRVSQFDKKEVRVVIDVNQRLKYNVFLSPDKKNITIESKDDFSSPESGTPSSTPLKEVKSDITNIIRLTTQEISSGVQLMIFGDNPLRYRYKEIFEPPQIILEIPSSSFLLPYKEWIIEKGRVNKVVITSSENKVILKIELTEPALTDVSLLNSNRQIVLKIMGGEKKSEEIEKEEVISVTKEEKIPEAPLFFFAYPEINKITAKKDNKKVKLQIIGNEEIAYKVKEEEFPTQIIITIPDFTLNIERNIIEVGISNIKNIEASQTSLEPPTSLIKINFTQKTNYDIKHSSDRKEIIVEMEVVEAELPTEKERITTKPKEIKIIPSRFSLVNILDINFQKLPEETVVSIAGDETLRYKFIELEKPDKFVIEIHNALLKTKKRKVKVGYGGIKSIEISQTKSDSVPVVKSEILLEKKLEREISLSPSLKQIILSIKKPKVEEIVVIKKEIELPPETFDVIPLPPTFPRTNLITMDFKDADVRDVIKVFSEMTGANLVVDDGVSGKVTVSLRNVPFEQALEMILAPNDLMVHLIDNTFVVVPRKDTKLLGRIGGAVMGGFLVESFSIRDYTPEQFENILKEIMPEFEGKRISTGRTDTITLIGTRKSLDKVKNFMSVLQPIPGAEIRTFNLKGQKYEDVEKILKQTLPEIESGIVKDIEPKSSITIVGSKENLARAEKVISGLSLPPSYQIFELTATEPEKFRTILSQLYPQVEIIYTDAGSKSISVTLKGNKGDFSEIEKLVQELNQKKSQPKDIEIIKLEHFETISKLQEQEGEDIAKLLTAMVPEVKITPDKRTNSIIVEGTSLDIRRIKELLPKIDVKVPIVRLYVQVIDSKSPISKYLTPGLLGKSSSGSFNTMTGDLQLNFIREEATKILRATLSNLETKEEIRYLTNTELHTFSGRQVKLDMRDKHTILIPGGPILDGQGRIVGTTPPSYSTLDGAGITIEVTPRVKSEKIGDKSEENIVLLINITVYSPTTEKPIKEATIGLNERKIQDVLVRTRSGESIVISGLLTQYERESITSVPLLSNIPFVKSLFTRKSSETTGSEVTVMITPEINPTK